MSPIAGESAALHPEFLPQVHVDHLVRALQMEYDAIWPGAAAKDLLQGLHLHRGGVAGHVEMDHLVADPALVAGVIEGEDLIGDHLGRLGALLIVTRGRPRIDLSPDDHDSIREQQLAALFEHSGKDDNLDGGGQVFELHERHCLASLRDHRADRLDHPADANFKVLHLGRHLVRIGVDFQMQLLLDPPQRMIGEIEPEEFLFAAKPLVIGHGQHRGDQPGGGVVHFVGVRQHPE